MANCHVDLPWLSVVLLFTIMVWSPQHADSAAVTKGPIVCKNGETATVDLKDLNSFKWQSPPRPAKGKPAPFDCNLIVKRSVKDLGQEKDGQPFNQLKLTFFVFNLNPPNGDGICDTDNLAVSNYSGGNRYLGIDVPENNCGRETPDTLVNEKNKTFYFHRIINFEENGKTSYDDITFKLTTGAVKDQKFDISFQAYRTNDVLYAPSSCSQYYIMKDKETIIFKTPNFPGSLKTKFPQPVPKKSFTQLYCFSAGYKTSKASDGFNLPIQTITLTPEKGTDGKPPFTLLQNGTTAKTSLHDKPKDSYEGCPSSRIAYPSNAPATPVHTRYCGAHWNNRNTTDEKELDEPVKFTALDRKYKKDQLNEIKINSILAKGVKLGYRFRVTATLYTKAPVATLRSAT